MQHATSLPNVLAERYATQPMRMIWSVEGKIILEREFWIAVMKAQRDLGIDIPAAAIASYESVKSQVDLESIMQRERVTRHDVKARIEEFCDLAGHEHIHKGLTSRDLTENVEQLQVYGSITEVLNKGAAALAAMAERAGQFKHLVITARTHNVAAQTTTLGKRFATFGEEMLGAFQNLEHIADNYFARGLKGAVGTQLDQLSLFAGDSNKVAQLERRVIKHLGLPKTFTNVGQVYPRSLDLRVVSALCDLASGPGNFAKTLRLMAGHELASEGFAEGQVGSSAMPHKMNSRSCERINGFHTLLKGYLTMASGLAGDQWNEGDVSCSVVRRVMLPDAFFSIDGLLETFITVIAQLEAFPAVIDKELDYYLPFLSSTTFLMEAIKAGAGREAAHEAIKEHSVAAVLALRFGDSSGNDLLERLANDERLGIPLADLQKHLNASRSKTGAANQQVDAFAAAIKKVTANYPDAANYKPGAIL